MNSRIMYNPVEDNAPYILIPGGKYRYSVTSEEVEVPSLYFAKYPVTNKLYRRFVSFLETGMSRDQFADSLLEKTNQVRGFEEYLGKDTIQLADKLRSQYNNDRRFNGDDQPVVGVSWYAAMAYCVWLNESQKANNKSQEEREMIYRLPTELEWEWAASGGKRKYPWGNEEPDDNCANYSEKVGHTTPVGAYPAGTTPEGLMDMAGNVWEWMENLYREGGSARMLRGGSWEFSANNLQCIARYFFDSRYVWDISFGFRIVCTQS